MILKKKVRLSQRDKEMRSAIESIADSIKDIYGLKFSVHVGVSSKKILAQANVTSKEIIFNCRINPSAFFQVLFHELVHIMGFRGHNEGCPLMKSMYVPMTSDDAQKLFNIYYQILHLNRQQKKDAA